MLELGMYAATGFRSVRARIEMLTPSRIAAGLVLTAIIPYLIYTVGTGVFQLRSALALLAWVTLASFWYVVLGRRSAADVGFLILMAVPILFKAFRDLYVDAVPRLQASVLGVLMWYRIGIFAVLCIRRMEGIEFGFVPLLREWRIGVWNYLLFLPVGVALAYSVEFIRPSPLPIDLRTAGIAAGTFLVTLWGLALAEEVFFRGLLQQMLAKKLKANAVAIVLASLIFGSVHLAFREFPNWKFALLATCAGIFYGRAYWQAQSVRAAMVTHALVVTTWRVFLA